MSIVLQSVLAVGSIDLQDHLDMCHSTAMYLASYMQAYQCQS